MLVVAREIHLGEDQDTVDAASLTPSQSRENKRFAPSPPWQRTPTRRSPILRLTQHSVEMMEVEEFLFRLQEIIVG